MLVMTTQMHSGLDVYPTHHGPSQRRNENFEDTACEQNSISVPDFETVMSVT